MIEELAITDTVEESDGGTRQALFLRLLAGVYEDLEGYVAALVVHGPDADDVLQEACVYMWSEFASYELGTSFRKWAFTVAFNRARAYWRDRDRSRGVALTDAVLGKLARVHESAIEIAEIRLRLLDECLDALPSGDAKLVRQLYHERLPVADAAARRGSSPGAIYTRLSRIRKKLAACVERKMT